MLTIYANATRAAQRTFAPGASHKTVINKVFTELDNAAATDHTLNLLGEQAPVDYSARRFVVRESG
ncbi:MAG: hypothetical protein ACE5FO_03240 [Parvularculaceae bacterium]